MSRQKYVNYDKGMVLKMNRLKRYTLAGVLFTLVAGTLAHFVYEWTGNNMIAGLFFPINESTWEHMKLVFFPMLLYSFFMERKLRDEYPCIKSALTCGLLSGTFLVPVLFYFYTGVLGFHTLPLDILTFILSVLFGFRILYKYSCSCKAKPYAAILKLLVCITAICFLLFSYAPPAIGLFAG